MMHFQLFKCTPVHFRSLPSMPSSLYGLTCCFSIKKLQTKPANMSFLGTNMHKFEDKTSTNMSFSNIYLNANLCLALC